jgi:hypothetical protein
MSKGHATREIGKDREQNLKNPALPNTTKVVRLVIVPPGRSIASTRSPTRTDVFVVTDEEGKLHPKTWLGDGLVDHEEAHHQHRGTVLIVKGLDRDQIEWQCDVPFRVSQIEKTAGHHFQNFKGPNYPFMMGLDRLTELRGGPGQPIRSGPVKVIRGITGRPIEWKQLYKAHFELKIGRTWKPLDPDFYCDWR